MALQQGMSGPAVRDLQIALNARLNPSPNLRVTGLFDGATVQALRMFQQANWLETDAVAGAATLDALHGREERAPARHNLPYIPQPNAHLGWAAATAMLRRSSVMAVRQMTPSRFLNPQGDLISEGPARAELHRAFASQHGLRYRQPKGWPVSALVSLMAAGPVMVEFLRPPSSQRGGVTSQFLVLVGLRGANRPDGSSTTLRVHDPDQDHQHGVYSITFANLFRSIPVGGFALFSI